MDITDFLPKYPSIEPSKYGVLNPYDENFYEVLFKKKEFYENRLEITESFPQEKGMLTKYQKTIVRYMASHTPYDRLLLVHSMGLGKCVLGSTVVYINNEKITMSDAWTRYYSPKTLFQDEYGDWTQPRGTCTVQSIDINTKQLLPANVLHLYRQYITENVKLIITQSSKITCTKLHKLFSLERGWIESPNIGEHVSILSKNQLIHEPVLNIIEMHHSGWVYDLEVEKHHNYIADNFITHNTCSAIGAIEQIKNSSSAFTGAMIFAKNSNILDNFLNELVDKCTAGQYIPNNYTRLTPLERVHRIKKNTQFYTLQTFAKFAKRLKKLGDRDIIDFYSNKIIVIDEVHNIRIQDDGDNMDAIEIYNQFHRFLHLVLNCKVLLLSGTPMKDDPSEIASIANLILSMEKQLPIEEDFLKAFMETKDGGHVYTVRENAVDNLKEHLQGKISFLKEAESTVKKDFLGQKKYGRLKYFVVDPLVMSTFQTKVYVPTYQNTTKDIYVNAREASLFVYPDGSYGS